MPFYLDFDATELRTYPRSFKRPFNVLDSNCPGVRLCLSFANYSLRGLQGFGQVFPDVFNKIYLDFATSENWLLYDDCQDTLQKLKRLNLILCVVSNFDERLGTTFDRFYESS